MDNDNLLDLQNIVLGSMIMFPDTVGPALAELQEGDFTTVATQGLFQAIRKLHAQRAPINLFSMSAELGREYEYYINLAVTVATRDITYYVGKLRDVSRLTAIQRAASDLMDCADLEGAETLISKINELSSARRGVQIITVGQAVRKYMASIGKTRPEFIRMGLRIFDDEILLRKGRYFVIGGYASSGKTLLTLQMARYVGQRYKVGYFSFETDDWDIAVRMLSSESGVHNKKVMRQDLNDADKAALEESAKKLDYLKVELVQATGMTADDIRAITLSRKYDVIFIDYLQDVEGSNPRATSYEKVSAISRKLQALSRTGEVLVVALSQLSRPEVRKDGKLIPPSMSSLRESGQIEQDADVIALLFAEDPDDNMSNRVFKVAKNKDGEKLDLSLSFAGAMQRLEVLGRRRRPDPKKQKQAADGSGFMLIPEGRGAPPPESFTQQKMAF